MTTADVNGDNVLGKTHTLRSIDLGACKINTFVMVMIFIPSADILLSELISITENSGHDIQAFGTPAAFLGGVIQRVFILGLLLSIFTFL